MDYEQKHLLDWLKERPLIGITRLERASDCPKDVLRHFLKARRSLPSDRFVAVERALRPYGYLPLLQG